MRIDKDDKDVLDLVSKIKQDTTEEIEQDIANAEVLGGATYTIKVGNEIIRIGSPTLRSVVVLQNLENPHARVIHREDQNLTVDLEIIAITLATLEMTTTRKDEIKGLSREETKQIILQRADDILDLLPLTDLPQFVNDFAELLVKCFPVVKKEEGGENVEPFPLNQVDRTNDENLEMSP